MLNKIEIPSEVTKYFVTIKDDKQLRYYLGYYGIYVDKIKPLLNTKSKVNTPTIITVLYDDDEQLHYLEDFASNEIIMRRIFKSMTVPANEKLDKRIIAFANNTSRNLLHIAKGKTIRVLCKESRDLQDFFYNIFTKVNETEDTGCKFDYDDYDITFSAKEYSSKDGKYSIVTFVKGL